ncbi:unnamed protein product [Owenia fusiformis]|uniref:Uncharacterized protein n=1 Tax=Owenia fusiformis TaxID=6347 RepID=A0A8J1XX34_OWEFU|nr:unnamed protein product [Owenia fusiformis]
MSEAKKPRKRTPYFNIEVQGDETIKDRFRKKMKTVKEKLKSDVNVSTAVALETVLDFWILHNVQNENDVEKHSNGPDVYEYTPVERDNTLEPMFLTTKSATEKLINTLAAHSATCNSLLSWNEHSFHGHAALVHLKCDFDHQVRWKSSPTLPNGQSLVNYQIFQGYITSGMLPNQYDNLSKTADFGHISKRKQKDMTQLFAQQVEHCMTASCEEAFVTEFAHLDPDELQDGISIMTDARHGWRKNANDCDIVCIGLSSHKVLKSVHITKADDPIPQRHEMVGTRQLYDFFDEKGINIKVHAHDANQSVNKFVRERDGTTNQNDTWHGGKSLKKEIEKVGKGPQYSHGQTWHMELSDKVIPVQKQFHWAVRNCNNNEAQLRDQLDNILCHFKNIHHHCDPQSRCRTDPNYQIRYIIIRDPVAEDLFRTAIRKSIVYRQAQNYTNALDTFYVESFNNVLNVFHDKRIVFGKEQYEMRTNLTILHWNENVDRDFTSTWEKRDENLIIQTRKNLKPVTFQYKSLIWEKVMDNIFPLG